MIFTSNGVQNAMKDAYIIFDYTYAEKSHTSQRTPHLSRYAEIKSTNASSAISYHAKISSETKALELRAAADFITSKLKTWRYTNIKFIISGHGQYEQSGGLVSGDTGTAVWISIETIAADILTVIQAVNLGKLSYPVWHFKLCICYAARSTVNYQTPPLANQSVMNPDNSLAGRLSKQLKSLGLQNFTLKAYFTPVNIDQHNGHLRAHTERNFQQKHQRFKLLEEKKLLYPKGYAFWEASREKTPEEAEFVDGLNFCCTVAYAEIEYKVDPSNIEVKFFTAFSQFLPMFEAEFSKLDDWKEVLSYRAWDSYHATVVSESISQANKITWTCENTTLQANIHSEETALI
ncbi:hypothetical protein IB691_03020 [Fangia hongkongensis]|nr:hypothetical protein [Fangia hongkongensis]